MSSDMRFRSGGSRPSRRNSSRACWYWKTTGVVTGAGTPRSRGRLALHQAADVAAGRAPERHRVHDPAHEVHAEAARAALARVALQVDLRHRRAGRPARRRPRPRPQNSRPRPVEAQLDGAAGRAAVGVLDHVGRPPRPRRGPAGSACAPSKPAHLRHPPRHVADEAEERRLGSGTAEDEPGRGAAPLTPGRASRLPALAEAQDRLHLRGEDPVEVVEAQDLEDVPHGLVELGQADVAAVRRGSPRSTPMIAPRPALAM